MEIAHEGGGDRLTMARVRIFVPTYRRHNLLRGALDSLRAQSFTDWVAEVHNDDPSDDFPGRLAQEMADPRITSITHPRNLGATAAFNLFFQSAAEDFTSILEDDNVWAPDFLACMLAAAEIHPDAAIFWANMRVRAENPDGTLVDTGRTLWPVPDQPGVRRLAWGQPAQIIGALHSNGAMLVRQPLRTPLAVPDVPFAFIEPCRERMFPHPLVLVERPLATFTLTRATARSDSRAEHLEMQTMLAATFLRHASADPLHMTRVWQWACAQNPPCTAPLLAAGLHVPQARVFWKRCPFPRLLRFLASLVLRPRCLFALLASRQRHAPWWTFLETHTQDRFRQ